MLSYLSSPEVTLEERVFADGLSEDLWGLHEVSLQNRL